MNEKTKKSLLLSIILLSALPGIVLAGNPELNWLYVSTTTGFIGAILILWQYILGTRSVSGLYFNDLPWITQLHVKFGIWGSLFIFAHPIAATILYSKSWFYSFTLDFSSPLETSVTYGRIGFFIILFIWLTSAIFRKFLSYRLWKYLHYLAYASLPFVFFHAPSIGTSFVDQAAYAYWYSLVGVFIVFTVLRLRMFISIGRTKYRVSKVSKLNGHVVLLQLKPQQKKLSIRPGQYVYLRRSIVGESHPFSVAHYDKKSGSIYVAFKVFGRYTAELKNITQGAKLYIDGPYGTFTDDANSSENKQTVFIAGGIGITPFLMHLFNPRFKNKQLLYANRQQAGANFLSSLRQELGDNFHEFYSSDDSQPPQKITVDSIKDRVADWKNAEYFICGPTPMMRSLKKGLRSSGVPNANIHVEEFSF